MCRGDWHAIGVTILLITAALSFIGGFILSKAIEKRRYENIVEELKAIDGTNVIILEKILTILETLLLSNNSVGANSDGGAMKKR